MTDRKGSVSRSVSGTKARTTEGSFYYCTGVNECAKGTVFHKLHVHRHGSRIYAQNKLPVTGVFALENVCSGTDVFKTAACTTGNNSLVYIKFSVNNFIVKVKVYLVSKAYLCTIFCFCKNITQVCVYFINCVCAAWMERHGNHWANLAKIKLDYTVIISTVCRLKFFVSLWASVNCIPLLYFAVRFPDT